MQQEEWATEDMEAPDCPWGAFVSIATKRESLSQCHKQNPSGKTSAKGHQVRDPNKYFPMILWKIQYTTFFISPKRSLISFESYISVYLVL